MIDFDTMKRRHSLTALPGLGTWIGILLLLSPLSTASGMEPVPIEVETLDVIEITGAAVEHEPRELAFPIPIISNSVSLLNAPDLILPDLPLATPLPKSHRVLLDQTAKVTKLYVPVKPLHTPRPLYPRHAREQGWHGRAILQIKVLSDGTVGACTIQESSGYPLLDDQAMKAANQWTFEPAKNGGFPISTTVNIPIQYDLVR